MAQIVNLEPSRLRAPKPAFIGSYRRFNDLTKIVKTVPHRLRVGSYRVVYEKQDDRLFIIVIRIEHRNDVYSF